MAPHQREEVRKPQARPAQPGGTGGRKGRLHERWLETCTRLETPNEDLRHAYRQSVEDMGALRIFDREPTQRQPICLKDSHRSTR